eukprot:scaffold24522_cov127-Cylindrotheca_fusiformis.AAC.3
MTRSLDQWSARSPYRHRRTDFELVELLSNLVRVAMTRSGHLSWFRRSTSLDGMTIRKGTMSAKREDTPRKEPLPAVGDDDDDEN